MNRKTIGKLRSQTGASLSFALLLFLVCAVLCSVILVSATTAAGRMSKIAETDQRYYAVTSAAELLKELINGKTVTIEEVTKGTRIEVYLNGVLVPEDYDEDGNIKSHASGTVYNGETTVYKIGSDTANPSEYPTFSSIPEDAAYKYFFKVNTPDTLIVSLDVGDTLAVTISETVAPKGDINEGDITLTVGDKYKIELVFSASVNGPTESETATDEGTTVVSSETDTDYTITTGMEKTETTTLTWTLTGIKTFA